MNFHLLIKKPTLLGGLCKIPPFSLGILVILALEGANLMVFLSGKGAQTLAFVAPIRFFIFFYGLLFPHIFGLKKIVLPPLVGIAFSKNNGSPCSLACVILTLFPLGFYALWNFFGTLAREVLQKKQSGVTSSVGVPFFFILLQNQ